MSFPQQPVLTTERTMMNRRLCQEILYSCDGRGPCGEKKYPWPHGYYHLIL